MCLTYVTEVPKTLTIAFRFRYCASAWRFQRNANTFCSVTQAV